MSLTPEAAEALGKPQSFHVETVVGEEEWNGKYGAMKTYRLRLTIGEEVDLNQKPETAAPQPGQEIYGHLEDGKYRPRLKKDKRPDGSTASSGSADYSRRSQGKSPDQQRSIVRQHSQEMALRYLAAVGFKPDPKDLDYRDALDKCVKPFIDWFEADANGTSIEQVKEAFSAKPAPAEGSTGTDDDIPF